LASGNVLNRLARFSGARAATRPSGPPRTGRRGGAAGGETRGGASRRPDEPKARQDMKEIRSGGNARRYSVSEQNLWEKNKAAGERGPQRGNRPPSSGRAKQADLRGQIRASTEGQAGGPRDLSGTVGGNQVSNSAPRFSIVDRFRKMGGGKGNLGEQGIYEG